MKKSLQNQAEQRLADHGWRKLSYPLAIMLVLLAGACSVAPTPGRGSANPSPVPPVSPLANTPTAVALANGTPETSLYDYIYVAPESPLDKRYDFHWEILKTALDETQADFGPYRLAPAAVMTEDRQVSELQSSSGALTVLVRGATPNYAALFVSVPIPIDRGLLGYRVFLIRKEDQPKFDAVKTLADLTQFTVGQEGDWGDVDILKANNFKVVTGSNYDGLFEMLLNKRFDLFSRSVKEVIAEYDLRKDAMPELAIEKHLMIYYPIPQYFWFSKSAAGQTRAKRVQAGMLKMMADGAYDHIFNRYHQDLITTLNLRARILFRLTNPYLLPDTPFQDKRLWFDPTAP